MINQAKIMLCLMFLGHPCYAGGWECFDEHPEGYCISYRYEVPKGWLVSVSDVHGGLNGVTYYPDRMHAWKIK